MVFVEGSCWKVLGFGNLFCGIPLGCGEDLSEFLCRSIYESDCRDDLFRFFFSDPFCGFKRRLDDDLPSIETFMVNGFVR